MSEEEIKKVARETFLESVMKNFDSVVIFEYIQTLERENKQLKSVLKKIREYIKEQTKEIENTNDKTTHCLSYQDLIDEYKELLEIIDKGIGEDK